MKKNSTVVTRPMFVVCAVLMPLVLIGTVSGQTCRLVLQTDTLYTKAPLFLKSNGNRWQMVWPKAEDKAGVFTINNNESLVLACPGDKNYQKTSGAETAIVTCSQGQLRFQPQNRSVNADTTECTKKNGIPSTIIVTQRSCVNRPRSGVIVQVGFQVESSFLPLIDICHNVDTMETFYTHHRVLGNSIDGRIANVKERPDFSRTPPLYLHFTPRSHYTKDSQKKLFENMFGGDHVDDFITNTSYLAKGHLTPDKDFIYFPSQRITYLYANAAPQWQIFNQGYWLQVENRIRKLAQERRTDIEVFTGTYGVLKLADRHGQVKPIYLAGNGIYPVPEVFWKVVRDPSTNQCLAIIGLNNPFLASTPTRKCTRKFPPSWPVLTDLSKGYTYYCDYHSFKKEFIDYIPDINCTSTL